MSRWAVVGVPDTLRNGGELRASHLFRNLIERTNALSFYRPDVHFPTRAMRHVRSLLPGVNIAAAELLPQASLPLARRLTRLRVLDLHDHPVVQAEAMGVHWDDAERARQDRLTASNLAAFDRIVVVSESFADLAGVPQVQRIAISNGTDTRSIVPGPWPSRPTVGFISGAAPGRGVESIVEAVRIIRQADPDVLLKLGLAAPNLASAHYLSGLRQELAGEAWVEIRTVPYREVGRYLASTTVLAIPHPNHPYYDSALPVKLFDGLAAGRPVVVTPRLETARIVRTSGAGIVTRSDAVEDLAAAIETCLQDRSSRERMGRNARLVAEKKYDWEALSRRLSSALGL
jgi:glycosyltransferase involved in cell wall biosynthesis